MSVLADSPVLDEVDLESLLPDVWIAAHPEHFMHIAAMRPRRLRSASLTPGATPGESPGT